MSERESTRLGFLHATPAIVSQPSYHSSCVITAAGEEGEATGAGGGAGAAAAVALDNEGHVAGLQLEDAADFVALGQLLGKRLVEVDVRPRCVLDYATDSQLRGNGWCVHRTLRM